MASLTENELKSQIKSCKLNNLYLLYGEEKYLISHYTNKLIDVALNDTINDFNFKKFKTSNTSVDSLEEFIEVLPFLSSKKCVVVSDLELEKFSVTEIKKLKEIVSKIPETTVLIISQSNIEANTYKSSKWNSFIKLIEKHGNAVNLKKLSRLSLEKQIINWAKKLNLNISQNSIEKLIEYCGDDLLNLRSELEKLSAFVDNREITEDDIELLVSKKAEANVFDLTKSVSQNNYDRALKILHVLLEKKEEPVAILSLLASNYIDMYRVKVAKNSGVPTNQIAELFDYKRKEFRLNLASKACDNYSVKDLRKYISFLKEIDLKLKSSKDDNKILLEELLVKLSPQFSK